MCDTLFLHFNNIKDFLAVALNDLKFSVLICQHDRDFEALEREESSNTRYATTLLILQGLHLLILVPIV